MSGSFALRLERAVDVLPVGGAPIDQSSLMSNSSKSTISSPVQLVPNIGQSDGMSECSIPAKSSLHVSFFNSLPFVSLQKAHQPGCCDLSLIDENKETLESLEHSWGINYGSLFSTSGPLISRIWFEKGMFTLGIDSTGHK